MPYTSWPSLCKAMLGNVHLLSKVLLHSQNTESHAKDMCCVWFFVVVLFCFCKGQFGSLRNFPQTARLHLNACHRVSSFTLVNCAHRKNLEWVMAELLLRRHTYRIMFIESCGKIFLTFKIFNFLIKELKMCITGHTLEHNGSDHKEGPVWVATMRVYYERICKNKDRHLRSNYTVDHWKHEKDPGYNRVRILATILIQSLADRK